MFTVVSIPNISAVFFGLGALCGFNLNPSILQLVLYTLLLRCLIWIIILVRTFGRNFKRQKKLFMRLPSSWRSCFRMYYIYQRRVCPQASKMLSHIVLHTMRCPASTLLD